ncbi:GTP cyclohydrolase MptA [Methanocaldococcus villosus]|uniref:GTP cyclohydrolase MptA n=1 Tax=Methanocaldococcus villosus TaxID=667126 RepID=UPI000373F742|nr:GTP cyclohydrolase MptA [Methanocaldococcus villosus]
MNWSCDIQNFEPDVKISLTRVGVKNLKKLIRIKRKNKRPIILLSTFNVFVNLPSSQKGIHMSRNPEVIEEIIDSALEKDSYEIEEIGAEIVKKLFEKHNYATEAEVIMISDFMVKEKSPVSKKLSQEVHKIIGGAKGRKEGEKIKITKIVGAEVIGITACPCAQNLIREISAKNLMKLGYSKEEIERILDAVILATHNQRGIGKIILEIPEGYNVEIMDIIDIIKKSMSSEIYGILKRDDEAYIVEKSHKNPKFVEDCVREMAKHIVEKFSYLPDDTKVVITQINLESIHRHDAFAEKKATLGELRKELCEII